MKSKKLLKELTDYCEANPNQRFWQALSNITGKYVFFADELDIETMKPQGLKDTYYIE
jgi:hypothetical protein